jgi:hypothetical protein
MSLFGCVFDINGPPDDAYFAPLHPDQFLLRSTMRCASLTIILSPLQTNDSANAAHPKSNRDASYSQWGEGEMEGVKRTLREVQKAPDGIAIDILYEAN